DHPLRYYRRRLSTIGATRAQDLIYLPQGTVVKVAGLVMSRQRPATANGVVFITLEDETESIQLVVYERVFERFHAIARHEQLLLVEGTIQRDEKQPLPKKSTAKPNGSTENTVPTSVVHVVARHFSKLNTLHTVRKQPPPARHAKASAKKQTSKLKYRPRNFH
ncbi:MAG: OB-fold nucleic acid binding domain-containing protein, partial [Polyangiaceae bacterium]|nr:OB-fold nucleic acid binding domain-containing protein [Polyangiaceae bacterium]